MRRIVWVNVCKVLIDCCTAAESTSLLGVEAKSIE
jgi:hypothetical protein